MSLTSEEACRVLSALMEAISTQPRRMRALVRETGCDAEALIDALAGRIEALPASNDAQALRVLTKALDRLRMVDASLREYAQFAPEYASRQGTILLLLRELREESERLWRLHQRAIGARLEAAEAEVEEDEEDEG